MPGSSRTDECNATESDCCESSTKSNPTHASGTPTDDTPLPEGTGWISGLRIVGLCTLLSRVLGLIRDMGMAALFGTGVVMDAFSVAYRIPNLARRLFGEGALTAAFLPVFVREDAHSGRDSAWRLATSVLSALAVVLCGIVLVGELLLWLLHGFGGFGAETQLLIELTAMMLPYLLLICLAAQVSAVLHALGHFTWPALLPVILNVVWIAGLWTVIPNLSEAESQIYAVTGCVLIGGCLQFVAPIPKLFQLGYRYDLAWSQTKTAVREIGRAMLPIVLGLSITQINTLADSLIAWGFSAPPNGNTDAGLFGRFAYPLESGTASALYFGQRMYQFPLGVFGAALGTVLFPLLARHAQNHRLDALRDVLTTGLSLVISIGVPASVGLMLIANPLTVLLFQHGAFDAHASQQTSTMIVAYGCAVWAYCGLLIAHRAYYAIGDRSTPLRVGVVAVICNLLLNLTLIWFIGGVGLALATAFCATGQFIAVAWLVQSHIGRLDWRRIGTTTFRTALATMVMAAACLLALNYAGIDSDDASLGERLLHVLFPVAASIAAFGIVARLIGLNEFELLWKRRAAGSDDESSQ